MKSVKNSENKSGKNKKKIMKISTFYMQTTSKSVRAKALPCQNKFVFSRDFFGFNLNHIYNEKTAEMEHIEYETA